MPDHEQKSHRYEPSMQGDARGSGSSPLFCMLFFLCILMVLVSTAVSVHAIWKIMNTTGIFGILVDARGNRIPVQGYSEFVFGLSGILLFSTLAVMIGLSQPQR